MAGHSRTQRTRHGGSASTRDTHGTAGFSPQVSAPTVSQVRDGELVQAVDIGGGAVIETHVAVDAITETKIADDSISTPKLQANVVTTEKLSADAVIANVINAGGTVIIDSDGITIKDEYGSSALTSVGFSGSWERFLISGLYNNQFDQGSDGPLTFGAQPSLSEVPYWWYQLRTNSTMEVSRITVPSVGQHVLQFDPKQVSGTALSANVRHSAYIPVQDGRNLVVRAAWAAYGTTVAKPTRLRTTVYFFDADLSYISAIAGDAPDRTVDDTDWSWDILGSFTAPDLAAYALVDIGGYWPSGTDSATATKVWVREVVARTDNWEFQKLKFQAGSPLIAESYGDALLKFSGPPDVTIEVEPETNSDLGSFRVRGTGNYLVNLGSDAGVPYLELGNGSSTYDVRLERAAAGELKVVTGTLFGKAPGVMISKTTNQSISNASYTTITSWSSTPYDGAFVSFDGTDELVVSKSGIYLARIQAHFADNSSGLRIVAIDINNTSSSAPNAIYQVRHPVTADPNADIVGGSLFVQLTANDRVCLKVWQNSGASLNITGAVLDLFMIGTNS